MAGLLFVKETGTCTIPVTYSDGTSTTVTITATVTTPTLPQSSVTVTPPTPTTTKTVKVSGGDYSSVQAALNAAAAGWEIVIDANVTFAVGAITLPYRPGDSTGWVTLRSSAVASLPALDGTTNARVTPAHAIYMPQLVGDGVSGPYVIGAAAMARGYYLRGLDISVPYSVKAVNRLVAFGNGDETTANIPADLILNQCYVHGHADLNCAHGVGLQAAKTAAVNSWISEIHSDYSVYGDAQAIACWGSPGPLLIDNCYAEGGDENIAFGGSDLVNVGQLPTDITVTRTYLFKPPAWNKNLYGVHGDGAGGTGWRVKNLYEHKTGYRILFEGNILENYWHDNQLYALNFKSVNQAFGMPWAETGHGTFRYSIIRNSVSGMNITGNPLGMGNGGIGVPAHDLYIHDLLFQNMGADSDFGDAGNNNILNLTAPINNIHLAHLTMFGDNFGCQLSQDGNRPLLLGKHFVLRDSLLGTGNAIFKAGGNSGGTPSLNATFYPGWVLTGNVLVGGDSGSVPPGNYCPASRPTLNTDWSLPAGSPYKRAATDGLDIGCDVATTLTKTAGVDANNKGLASSTHNATGTSSTAALVSDSFTAVAHNTIAVVVSGTASTFTPTITDTAGNTYALAGAVQTVGGKKLALYVAYNVTANASNAVTFTEANTSFKEMAVLQFSGTRTVVSPLDQLVQGSGTASGTYTAPALSSSEANEILLLAAHDDLGGTLTLPAAFTPITAGTLVVGYQFVRSMFNKAQTVTDSNVSATVAAITALLK